MQQQTGLFFYRFRFLFAIVLTMAFLILVSALVTATGSKTILAHPSTSTLDMSASTSNSPIAIIAWVNTGAQDTESAMLSAGNALYRACRLVTTITARSGKSIENGSGVIAKSLWNSTAFEVHEIGTSIIFTLRLPAEVMSSIIKWSSVSSTIIKPADNESVPIISAETSAAVLLRFDAQQQQEIAQWQAAQLTANRSLGGTAIAGDPDYGGYPAKWASAAQDSTVDSWGMYNRECVSYTAWKVYQTYGYMPYWGGVGNANEWPFDAYRAGIATGSTPQVDSVAISMSGYYGHAMWVEKISGDMIYVSQYNYNLNGEYSEMWVNGSHFIYIYFK
jgi:surface antigen